MKKINAKNVNQNPPEIRPRKYKVVSIIIVVLLSSALLAGGVLSYFSYSGATGLVTVDGKEILTSHMVDTVRTQMDSFPVGTDDNQKMSYVVQMLQQPIEEAVWTAFALKQGLNYSSNSIQNSLKYLYEQEKKNYEQEEKTHFSLTYAQFLENMVDQFNASLVLTNSIGFSVANPLAVASDYSLNKINSIVEYQSISLKDFLMEGSNDTIKNYYDKSGMKEPSSKELAVLFFKTEKEANDFQEQLEKNATLGGSAFKKAKIVTLNKDSKDFIFVQNNKIDSTTSPFPYREQYIVGKVTKESFLPFNDLPHSKKGALIESYIETLKPKEIQKMLETIKELFRKETSSLIKKGVSSPIGINSSSMPMDSKTNDLLEFVSAENKDFYYAAFKPINTVSNTMIFNNIVYKITVLARQNPSFPIPALEKITLEKAILDKEKNFWYLNIRKKAMASTKVDISFDNLKTILLPQGN